jgi:hypothetical protein
MSMHRDLWDPHILCRKCDKSGCAWLQPPTAYLCIVALGLWSRLLAAGVGDVRRQGYHDVQIAAAEAGDARPDNADPSELAL